MLLTGGQNQLAETFILPSEQWKLEDLRSDISDANHYYNYLTPSLDTTAIEEITMETMNRYGYEPFGR